MSMLKDFKDFALRGNVVDMAVGIIIGAAFGKIVTSLVNDIIMPPIGLVLGQMDFSDLSLTLSEGAGDSKAVVLKYGLFINTVINFVIVAFSIFIVIGQMQRLRRTDKASPEPTTKPCPYCQSTIAIKATRCPQCTSQL